MQNKTLTIMFVDVQGYSSMTTLKTREEQQLFIGEIRNFINKHILAKGGKLVKEMGDGFMATFESPTDAIACGVAMQKEIARRNYNILDDSKFVKLRIGVSTGEVSIDEKSDVYGDAVNIASRVQNFAEPGEVYISDSAYLAMNKSEVQALDLGPQRFKNIMQEVRVYKVLKEAQPAVSVAAQKVYFNYKIFIWSGIAVFAVVGFIAMFISLGKLFSKPAVYSGSKISEPSVNNSQKNAWPKTAVSSYSKVDTQQKLKVQNYSPAIMPKLPGAVNNDQKTEYQSDPVLKRITQKNKFYAQIITNKEAQLKNDPENVTLCLDLAAFYARLEEYEKAEEYFIKAIEIKPEIAGGYFLLADLYKKQGKTEEEVAILNKCLESAQLQPDGRIKAELRLEELSKIKT